MKEINVDVVPLLPVKEIINEECVALGIIETGVLVHYLDRDKAMIVEWSDIVDLGLSDILRTITDVRIIREPTKE